MTATAPDDGFTDLEKELTCSICTDVLYQPLTLLDCLHTFCGYCLKEWFAWQATNSTRRWPFTCPSCRANVRETRPNATVTTLLEILLKAHPERLKPQKERDEIAKSYKPGDLVLAIQRTHSESDDSEDQRMLEQARQLSLANPSRRHPSREHRVDYDESHDSDSARRRRRRRAERASGQNAVVNESAPSRRAPSDTRDVPHLRHRRNDSGGLRAAIAPAHADPRESASVQSRRRREETIRSSGTGSNTPGPIRTLDRANLVARDRGLDHQSSLRSILSASSIDSEEMQEEIRRQIVEEGLLDDVDLNHLTRDQEEEITERIAQAYQRRQRDLSAHSSSNRRLSRSPHPDPVRSSNANALVEAEPTSQATLSPQHGGLLSVGRLSPANQRHGRSASHSTPQHDSGLTIVPHVASRSATDLAPPSVAESRSRARQPSPASRQGTDAGRSGGRAHSRRSGSDRQEVTQAGTTPSRHSVLAVPSPAASSDQAPGQSQQATQLPSSMPPASPVVEPTRGSPATQSSHVQREEHLPGPQHVSMSSRIVSGSRIIMAMLPSIDCSRCRKPSIESSLHYNCSICDDGHFFLCQQCYRAARGCFTWYGFGYAATNRFARIERSAAVEQPHILSARRYTALERHHTGDSSLSAVLEEGLFCESCSAHVDDCYWHCEYCNEGAWGFCQVCIQTGKHCTHPLEAMALKTLYSPDPPWLDSGNPFIPTDITAAQAKPPMVVAQPAPLPLRNKRLPHVSLPESYTAIVLPCDCDLCHRAIPISAPRYHCAVCPAGDGDYDICTNCYSNLTADGIINQIDGPNGWRRCPQGHRMVVVGFEEHDGGLQRILQRALVGGHALKEDAAALADSAQPQHDNSSKPAARWRWRESDGTVQTTDLPSSSGPTFPKAPSEPNSPGGHVGVPTSLSSSSAPQPTPLAPLSTAAYNAAGRLPPDGGVGLHVQALWSYYPSEQATDELAFPRGAEITEVENINEDWFWGVYAGNKGLFPGNHVRIVGGA